LEGGDSSLRAGIGKVLSGGRQGNKIKTGKTRAWVGAGWGRVFGNARE